MESRKRPIDELLDEVRRMRSNLERINKDLAFIKKKIDAKDDKDNFDVVETKEDIPSQRSWFSY